MPFGYSDDFGSRDLGMGQEDKTGKPLEPTVTIKTPSQNALRMDTLQLMLLCGSTLLVKSSGSWLSDKCAKKLG